MADILHELVIKTLPNKVYVALNDRRGLSHWWTREVNYEAIVNSIVELTFDHGNTEVRLKIVKLIPNRSIVWHCLQGFPEWQDTQIMFDLEAHKQGCILHFAHRGFRNIMGNYPKYNFEWAKYLASLRNYLEKGKGFPAR